MNRGSKPQPMRLALWMVAILLSLVVAPVYVTPAVAAAMPTPTSTPSGASYFITWRGSGSDTAVFSTAARGQYTSGIFGGSYEEYHKSISVRGSAVVRLNPQGNQFTSMHILWAADSYQLDEKDHETWRCGDIVIQHDHTSLKETNLTPKYPFPIMAPPAKRPDGTWVIKNLYPEWSDSGFHSHYSANCYGPSNRMIVDQNEIHAESINYSRWIIDGAPPGTFDVEATNPDGSLFSKRVSFERNDIEPLGRPPLKLQVSWEITARRIGKCLAAGSIPINDTTDYKLIDDEDVEMGVEYGKSSIDPNKGEAPLNLRVTCDGIPIKNAKVDVKVDPQKNTGGHMHDTGAGRPRGSLNGTTLTDNKPSVTVKTDDDGRAHLTFKPGKAKNRSDIGIAGIYQITARTRIPGAVATVAVTAETKGFDNKATGDANYVICRPTAGCSDQGEDADPKHTEGTYVTSVTITGLANMAADFHAAQQQHNADLQACGATPWTVHPLRASDMSLPMGGLLDITGDWKTPHISHGKPGAVDFSVNGWSDKTKKTCYAGGAATTSERGWLTATMANVGLDYGSWDKFDLCQHHDVCNSNGPPWEPCCGDNATCPPGPGGGAAGPPNYNACPGPTSCLHCPTDPLWHLWFNQ